MSDEFYHKLSMSHKDLPRSYKDKKLRSHKLSMSHKDLPRSYKDKKLRSEMTKAVTVDGLGESFYGAHRPFQDLLALCLSREVHVDVNNNYENALKIM